MLFLNAAEEFLTAAAAGAAAVAAEDDDDLATSLVCRRVVDLTMLIILFRYEAAIVGGL